MRAAAFATAVNEVEVREDATEPTLDPAGALLRVEAAGSRHRRADVLQRHPKAPPPWQLGHEPVGVLEEVGPQADLPPGAEGDRVFLGSILTCGECRWCRRASRTSASTICSTATSRSPAPTRSGPPSPDRDEEPDPAAAGAPQRSRDGRDPFACALNGIEQLEVRLGDTVGILGTGPIGCWQAVMARDRGASKVYLTDVSADRLEHRARRDIGQAVDDAWVSGDDNGVQEVLS